MHSKYVIFFADFCLIDYSSAPLEKQYNAKVFSYINNEASQLLTDSVNRSLR